MLTSAQGAHKFYLKGNRSKNTSWHENAQNVALNFFFFFFFSSSAGLTWLCYQYLYNRNSVPLCFRFGTAMKSRQRLAPDVYLILSPHMALFMIPLTFIQSIGHETAPSGAHFHNLSQNVPLRGMFS